MWVEVAAENWGFGGGREIVGPFVCDLQDYPCGVGGVFLVPGPLAGYLELERIGDLIEGVDTTAGSGSRFARRPATRSRGPLGRVRTPSFRCPRRRGGRTAAPHPRPVRPG